MRRVDPVLIMFHGLRRMRETQMKHKLPALQCVIMEKILCSWPLYGGMPNNATKWATLCKGNVLLHWLHPLPGVWVNNTFDWFHPLPGVWVKNTSDWFHSLSQVWVENTIDRFFPLPGVWVDNTFDWVHLLSRVCEWRTHLTGPHPLSGVWVKNTFDWFHPLSGV